MLVSSNRVLKESTADIDSVESRTKDGSSSAWATIAGTDSGTAIGIGTGSGSGDSIGFGIGVTGSGFGSGTGTGVGIGIGVGGESGLGTGVGIGIGGDGTVCDRHSCNHVKNEPKCSHGTRCNPNNEEPTIEIPVWPVPGECGGQGILFEPSVCVTSDCEEVGCDRVSGSSRTRKTNEVQSLVTDKH